MEATTGYARLGGDRISYRVSGTGPIDLVTTMGSFGSFDALTEDPAAKVYFAQAASFSRLIQFDRRGTGGSDPLPLDSLPPWESYVEEVEAIMDAVGSERAAVWASYNAGPMALLFAATKPERTEALVLYNTTARYLQDDDYPAGVPLEVAEQLVELVGETWGTTAHAAFYVPSKADDPAFLSWFSKVLRSSLSPTAAQANFRDLYRTDARSLLPSIQVPTLVVHRTGFNLIPFGQGKYIADSISGATMLEVPGSDAPLIWQEGQETLEAIGRFLTGTTTPEVSNRLLATVLFAEIMHSADTARELGDRGWRSLLDVHDEIGGKVILRHQGKLVKTTGSGFLATFEGPGRAIRCAIDLLAELSALEVDVRIGIHSGEIELRGDDVGGIAVHLAARVMAAAGPGEITVSRTVKDLVVGSDFQFLDKGSHLLKGIAEEWQLFSVQLHRQEVSARR